MAPRSRRRRETTDEREAQAALENARQELTNCQAIRAQRQAYRDDTAQALARHNESLASDAYQCAVLARKIAAIETRLAAYDPTALEDVIRRRIGAWVASTRARFLDRLVVTAAADLTAWEPQLTTCVPLLAAVVRDYPKMGYALESLLDLLLLWRQMDAIGAAEPVTNPKALLAALEKCERFLTGTARWFATYITSRLERMYARMQTTPRAWTDVVFVADSEMRHATWLLHVAEVHGQRLTDLDQPGALAELLAPERVARELHAAALACGLIADAVSDGLVPVKAVDVARGWAAEELTAFMHAQTGTWLYDTVGALMRVAMPWATTGWRPDGKLGGHVRHARRAHGKRAAEYRRAGSPPMRKMQGKEEGVFTPNRP